MDDPIIMLEEINAKMYDTMEEKYEYDMALRVFKHLFGTTQDDGESLQDYTKRFKQSQDNFKNTVGEDFLEQFMTVYENGTRNAVMMWIRKIVQKGSFEGFMAYLYMEQADHEEIRVIDKRI